MTRFSDSDTFIYEIFRMAFAANKVTRYLSMIMPQLAVQCKHHECCGLRAIAIMIVVARHTANKDKKALSWLHIAKLIWRKNGTILSLSPVEMNTPGQMTKPS